MKDIRDYLAYDPDTGILTWKVRPSYKIAAGAVAGHVTKQGYIAVGFDGKDIFAHRIAWFLTYGAWPKHILDHINSVPSDNRLCNLREATLSENCRNIRPTAHTSIYKGVYWHTSTGKWRAQIRVGGKSYHLGCFTDEATAYAAYCEAAPRFHGQFARVA